MPIWLPYALAAGASLISNRGKMKNLKADYTASLINQSMSEDAVREKAARISGDQRVAAAASGVEMAGSPLRALAETAQMAERDLWAIRRGGKMERDALDPNANNLSFLLDMAAIGTKAFGDTAGAYKSPDTPAPVGVAGEWRAPMLLPKKG